nr:uncharacterized protein LOC109159160 [Ipomoea batatas]
MSESDSQNVSARRYGGSVEVESFTVSSNDSVINTVGTYSHDASGPSRLADDVLVNKPDPVIPEDVSRPVTELLTLEVNTSGQGKPPRLTWALNDATIKISAETYKYSIFQTTKDYSNARLEPPRYDLNEKYAPKKAVATVVVGPPTRELGSTTMRSFPISARSPTPATKISLGSKKDEATNLDAKASDPFIPLAYH